MAKKKPSKTTKETVEEIKDNANGHLTPKQEAFLRAYLELGNAAEAYRRAYDTENMSEEAIRTEGGRLLKHPTITLRIQMFHEKAEAKSLLTLEEHMSELQTLRELAKQNAQLSAAITAEIKRGELRKFYVKQIETGDVGDFKRKSDDELQAEAVAIAERLKLVAVRPRQVNGNGSSSKH